MGGQDQDNPATVLIVDDHLLFAQALAAVLSVDAGLRVVGSARSVSEAEQFLERGPVDVVLLDYRLPDRTGLEALSSIRRLAPSAAVVMITANEEERVLLAAIEAGCSGFVPKTGDLNDVHAAIAQAAAGEASMSPALLSRLLRGLAKRTSDKGRDLTPRELQILQSMVAGHSNADIARGLVLSIHTVRNHVQNILAKLQAHSRLEAAAIAVRDGMVDPMP